MAHSWNTISEGAIVLLLSTACQSGHNVSPQVVIPKSQAAQARRTSAVAKASILPVMATSDEGHAATPNDAGAIAEGTR